MIKIIIYISELIGMCVVTTALIAIPWLAGWSIKLEWSAFSQICLVACTYSEWLALLAVFINERNKLDE